VFIVAKALELFVESLAVESFSFTSQSKKKTISKDDVFKAIDSVDSLAFLDGALDK
jgi:DNA polymerase epsilon subunit 4